MAKFVLEIHLASNSDLKKARAKTALAKILLNRHFRYFENRITPDCAILNLLTNVINIPSTLIYFFASWSIFPLQISSYLY